VCNVLEEELIVWGENRGVYGVFMGKFEIDHLLDIVVDGV